MNHLTPESWRRLRDGALQPSERAALLGHLAEECDRCDELVAGLDDPPLDCAIDAALASLAPAPVAESLALPHLERKILRQLFPPPPRRWLAAVPVLLAAAVALFFVNPFSPPGPEQREKGDGARAPALTAVVSVKQGAALEPLQPPHTYPGTAELYFTYDLPRDAHVYFGRVGVDGVVEPFYPPLGQSDAVEPAGLHALTVGGTVHAYSLEGLRGKQRFILLTSPTPLEGRRLAQALGDPSASSASVEIEVQGW